MQAAPLFSPDNSPLLDVAILGPPVGAARPRVVRLPSGASHTFMPDNTTSWEGRAIQTLRGIWGEREKLDEALSLEVVALCPRPKRLCRPRDPRGRVPALCKPDGDNVLKLAQDALVKAGVVKDDTRIVQARVLKLHVSIAPSEPEQVQIRLWRYLSE